MHGVIARIKALPGQRGALISVMLTDVADMPGCLSYVVALDANDDDALWVTEVWTSAAHHQDSLGLPEVKDSIARAMPLIAGFEQHVQTIPVGGHGIPDALHAERALPA